jgi:ApaG protein
MIDPAMKMLFPNAQTTDGVTVRVVASYLPEQSEPARGRWFWTYHIRVENDSDQAVQLMTRHWDIVDGEGRQNVVDGDGVIGEQPVIEPGESFDYVSGCPLTTPTGWMHGHYGMVAEDGRPFDAGIPRFQLLAPVTAR